MGRKKKTFLGCTKTGDGPELARRPQLADPCFRAHSCEVFFPIEGWEWRPPWSLEHEFLAHGRCSIVFTEGEEEGREAERRRNQGIKTPPN